MDIESLMNSLSIGESCINFKLFAAEIEGLHTDIVFGGFTDECMLIATQYEKINNLLKVKKDQVVSDCGASEPVYTVKALYGGVTIEQEAAARFIAEKLNIDNTILIFMNLKNYNRDTLLTVIDVLSEYCK